jgi:hypothetical protein
MRQSGKIIALAVITSLSAITVVGIFSITATRFVGSGDNLQLDVEVKPNNVKVRAAVNSDNSREKQSRKSFSSETTQEAKASID